MRKEKIELGQYHPPLAYEPPYVLDHYDKRILRELDENCRRSLADLSKSVGLSRDAIRNRIEKLVQHKIIVGFTPIYNPPKMGFPTINYVFLALYNSSEQQEKELLRYLKTNRHVTYVAGLIGKWDFVLDIMAPSPGHFDKILKEIRHKFPDLIKDYEIYGVLQEYKYEEIGKLVYG